MRIFEEISSAPKASHSSWVENSNHRWIEQIRLLDSRVPVLDIWFCPGLKPSAGFKLATVSADGVVRIYEALEPGIIDRWTLIDDFSVLDGSISREKERSFCLTWSPLRLGPLQLAVGAMSKVILFRPDENGKWKSQEELPGHSDLVRDVSWATSLSRGFELVCTACRDGHVRLFKMTPSNLSDGSYDMQLGFPTQLNDELSNTKLAQSSSFAYKIDCIADFPDHHADVWRVSWNAAGTMFSSTGDDGRVRLWREGLLPDQWKCAAVVSAESLPADDDMEETAAS